MSPTAGRRVLVLAVALAPIRRLAVATTCMALGLHPDAVMPGVTLLVARTRTSAVAAWQRVPLSWPSARSRRVRLTGDGPVGRRVPKSC